MILKDESSEAPEVRAQAEAAAWISLLHSSQRNAEIEAGLKRWIAADPLHAKVWEVATDIWNETSSLPRRVPSPPTVARRSRPSYLRPVLALAALCVLTVSGVVVQHFMRGNVSTVVGEQRTLNLEDGTRVELNTNSHLRVSYDRASRTVYLNSGEAYFQVAREQRPFVVIAGDREILALGTAFTVRRDAGLDDPLTVTLLEGRVAVAPVDQPEQAAPVAAATPTRDVRILNPGQRLRVHGHSAPTLDAPPMDKATGWMRGQLIFDHTPLRDAIAEFNRYSSRKITIATPEAGAIPVGGIFRISDSKSFARAVAETYNLELTSRGNDLILDRADAREPATQPEQSLSPAIPP